MIRRMLCVGKEMYALTCSFVCTCHVSWFNSRFCFMKVFASSSQRSTLLMYCCFLNLACVSLMSDWRWVYRVNEWGQNVIAEGHFQWRCKLRSPDVVCLIVFGTVEWLMVQFVLTGLRVLLNKGIFFSESQTFSMWSFCVGVSCAALSANSNDFSGRISRASLVQSCWRRAYVTESDSKIWLSSGMFSRRRFRVSMFPFWTALKKWWKTRETHLRWDSMSVVDPDDVWCRQVTRVCDKTTDYETLLTHEDRRGNSVLCLDSKKNCVKGTRLWPLPRTAVHTMPSDSCRLIDLPKRWTRSRSLLKTKRTGKRLTSQRKRASWSWNWLGWRV